jgi:hypothetical protein
MMSFYAADPDGIPVEFLQKTSIQHGDPAHQERDASATSA